MVEISYSLEDTKAFAKRFAKSLRNGDVVKLVGDLGAGKTTLVKYVSEFLGSDDLVTSPTFTILNEYSGSMPIHHFDMYRLKNSNEAVDSGLDEVLRSGDGVCFVEWPENTPEIIPPHHIEVHISKVEGGRKFEVVKK
ncbi:MAG: tRNA (adenosine(37)-N6)-threonylcarbamoyltransferase complex ATPase subunit type 1 TsaE [Clostridia bacterium]|nr:tRNA (adenosine(37)-N6)-threonylcarbamoyltransferase complex ATPase subunit type 1 TsaE [Clostridia bacterium]